MSIGFVPIGSADSDMQLLYMYLGDIDYFGLKFRTDEGRLEVLEEFYPQIIAVLKEMPDSCLNLKAVARSVRNFELTFDYSQLHDFDRRGDLEAAIEAYIRQLSAEALR